MRDVVRALLLFIVPVLTVAAVQWLFFRLFLRKGELTGRARLATVLWGLIGAMGMAIVLQLAVDKPVAQSGLQKDASLFLRGALWGPFSEEFAKGLAPLAAWLIFGVRGRRRLLVIGALSGTGFFVGEDILALIGGALESSHSYAFQLVMRVGLFACQHSAYTGMTGLAIGWASITQSKVAKCILPVTGFCIAFALHAWQNTLALAIEAGHGKEGWDLTFNAYTKTVLLYLILLAVARWRLSKEPLRREHVQVAV